MYYTSRYNCYQVLGNALVDVYMILCVCNDVRSGDSERYDLIGTTCGKCVNTAPEVSRKSPSPPEPPQQIHAVKWHGAMYETKQSIQKRRDHKNFMRGYKFALGIYN